MPNETSTLENSHSHSRISRVFENESSVWVRGSNEGVLEKTSKFEARMRAINLRILEDSWKLAYELFWHNRAVGMYQIFRSEFYWKYAATSAKSDWCVDLSLVSMALRKDMWRGRAKVPLLFLQPWGTLILRIFDDSREILKNSRNLRTRMRGYLSLRIFWG